MTGPTHDALLLGTDRADITPDPPIRLAGFAARASRGPATTVLAPLHLRTLAFATGPTGGSGPGGFAAQAVLLSADLLWWGSDLAATVRSALAERYGLPDHAVLLHATHNHSGPQTSRLFVPSLGAPDEAYLDRLAANAVEGVGRALSRLEPVRVERATGTAALAVDRRSVRAGGTPPAVRLDNTVTVVGFRRVADQKLAALLVHYACHPVVHHDNSVTSDYAGAAMDDLEARYPGAVAAFAQGCCGDVNPARYTGSRFEPGDQAEVARFGGELASAAERALRADPVRAGTVGAVRLETRAHDLALPVTPPPGIDELRRRAAGSGADAEWARLLLADPDRIRSTVPLRLSVLRLADRLVLLGMSGEPVTAYGRAVASMSSGTALPLGYTNGMTGYLVTARQLAEGGYETDEAPTYFGMPGRLAPEAEGVLLRGLRDALQAGSTVDGLDVRPTVN